MLNLIKIKEFKAFVATIGKTFYVLWYIKFLILQIIFKGLKIKNYN